MQNAYRGSRRTSTTSKQAAQALTLSEQRKDRQSIVRVRVCELGGHKFADVRVFAGADDASEFFPTQRGIALRASLIPEVITGLQSALSMLEGE